MTRTAHILGVVQKPRWPVAIFDLDGTLVDTIDLILASHRYAFTKVLGIDLPDAKLLSWIGLALDEVYQQQYPENAVALAAAYRDFNFKNAPLLTKSYPGITELLRELRKAGVRTGVATSKSRAASQVSLQAVGIANLIELASTCDDTATHKPDPAPLLEAARKLSASPDECVYIGDSIFDARAAQAAAMDCILVTYGAGALNDLALESATAIVKDPTELHQKLFDM